MKLRSVLIASSLGFVSIASAAVQVAELSKLIDYEQTSDTNVNANFFFADGYIQTDADGEAANGTLTRPDGTVLSPITNYPNQLFFQQVFSSEAQMNAAFTSGTYTFDVSDGPLAGKSGTLEESEDNFPSLVPMLTGDSFSRLQNYDVTHDITLTLNDPSHTSAYFTILGASFFATPGTTVTIPANTLVAGQSYTFFMSYSNWNDNAVATFDGAPVMGINGFTRSNRGSFTTAAAVPEPASFAAIAIGAATMLRRRWK